MNSPRCRAWAGSTVAGSKCAAFGNALHVSAARDCDLPAWLKHAQPRQRLDMGPITTGLEDVFIALTEDAQDNFG